MSRLRCRSKKTALSALALVGCLALEGCGFKPIYGTPSGSEHDSPVAMDLNNIAIDNIPDRNGQILRNFLIDRMVRANRPEKPLYTLKVAIATSEEDLGILANSTATRSLLNMYGHYTLVDSKGKTVVGGTAHSVASFNKLDQMYGTVAARENAYERTLHEVSEQIVNRLSLFFSERK